jgi:hypothetical protein
MAWMHAIGNCIFCGDIFDFNPNLVPSLVIDGEREPVCRACIEQANPMRVELGLEPITILPGAYEPEEVQ